MKLLILSALLLPAASAAQNAPPGGAEAPRTQSRGPDQAMPVLGQPRAGCMPIVQQVSGEKREYRGTRLDQQPPARMLYAVDRQVDGCREATFVNEMRIDGARGR